jgi:hypothetical protein
MRTGRPRVTIRATKPALEIAFGFLNLLIRKINGSNPSQRMHNYIISTVRNRGNQTFLNATFMFNQGFFPVGEGVTAATVDNPRAGSKRVKPSLISDNEVKLVFAAV